MKKHPAQLIVARTFCIRMEVEVTGMKREHNFIITEVYRSSEPQKQKEDCGRIITRYLRDRLRQAKEKRS